MSIHGSLRSGKGFAGAQRSVLKRHERVRWLMDKGEWKEGRSVFGLPKIKQIKVKSRKGPAKEESADTPKEPTKASAAAPEK